MGQIVSIAYQEHVGVFYFFFLIIILCFQHYIDQDTQAVCIVSVTSVIQFYGQRVQSLCLFLPSAFSFSCSKADLVSNGNIFCSLSLQGIRFVVFVRNEMQEKNTPLLRTLPPTLSPVSGYHLR